MAQLLCISSKTKKMTNNLGDVVGVFSDEHKFTEKERDLFDIVKIEDTAIDGVIPKTAKIFNDGSGWKVYEDEPDYKMRYNPQTKIVSHNYSGDELK